MILKVTQQNDLFYLLVYVLTDTSSDQMIRALSAARSWLPVSPEWWPE